MRVLRLRIHAHDRAFQARSFLSFAIAHTLGKRLLELFWLLVVAAGLQAVLDELSALVLIFGRLFDLFTDVDVLIFGLGFGIGEPLERIGKAFGILRLHALGNHFGDDSLDGCVLVLVSGLRLFSGLVDHIPLLVLLMQVFDSIGGSGDCVSKCHLLLLDGRIAVSCGYGSRVLSVTSIG